MSDEPKIFTDEGIAKRINRVLSAGPITVADPFNLSDMYTRALLVYIIDNTEGLSIVDAEQRYFQMVDKMLDAVEQGRRQAAILEGVRNGNGAQ